MLDREGILLDEPAPWFDDIAHEFEDTVASLGQIIDLGLQQRAGIRVKR
jgi:hypothetical protein